MDNPGQFDIVALWQARTSDEIVKSAFEKFPTLQGITHSETLLAPHHSSNNKHTS